MDSVKNGLQGLGGRLPHRGQPVLRWAMSVGVAGLVLVASPARAIELTPVSEREARQLADVLPDAPRLSPPAGAASQPVLLTLNPHTAEDPADRAMRLVDGHPGALALAALALALWGMRRTRRR